MRPDDGSVTGTHPTASPASKPSYAGLTDVVLAVLDARPGGATAQFDAELGAALDDGRIDAATARTLRWWQRESSRETRTYLAEVMPAILATLESAADGAADALRHATNAWATAGTAAEPREPVEPTPLVGLAAEPTEVETAVPDVAQPVALAEHRRRQVVTGLVSIESMSLDGSLDESTDGDDGSAGWR